MRRKDRYDTAGLDENQFEPGSRRRVVKNLLGITSKREMDQMEGREQVRVFEELASVYDSDHRFIAADICHMHRLFCCRTSWSGPKVATLLAGYVLALSGAETIEWLDRHQPGARLTPSQTYGGG